MGPVEFHLGILPNKPVSNLGLKPERLAAFEEKLKTMRALMKGECADYQGKELRMAWAKFDVPIASMPEPEPFVRGFAATVMPAISRQ